jgi:uncharacterized membrane protein YeaQ/YmgE (transglycosylase-associated protein family)
MTWTVTNLVIQIVAGVVGGYVAAALAKEHSFGSFGHAIAGAVAGLMSGYFLQTTIGTVATINGDLQEIQDPVTQWFYQSFGGLAAGAMATLVVGFLKHSIDHHGTGKT